MPHNLPLARGVTRRENSVKFDKLAYMYSQQTVVFVHVAMKCSYWNKCSVCVSILLPYKSALPTAVVWSVDNLLHNTR
jgi:hypothetical protein